MLNNNDYALKTFCLQYLYYYINSNGIRRAMRFICGRIESLKTSNNPAIVQRSIR